MVKNNNEVRNEIIEQIYNNGNKNITGLILQPILLDIFDTATNTLAGESGKTIYSAGNGIRIDSGYTISVATADFYLYQYAKISDVNNITNSALTSYYTINQVNNLISNNNLNYYTSAIIDSKLSSVTFYNSTFYNFNGFNFYYTKSQIDVKFSGLTMPTGITLLFDEVSSLSSFTYNVLLANLNNLSAYTYTNLNSLSSYTYLSVSQLSATTANQLVFLQNQINNVNAIAFAGLVMGG